MALVNKVVEADQHHTVNHNEAVKLRIECSNELPVSVATFVLESVWAHKWNTAMAVFRDGIWRKWTYREYLDDVKIIAKAFLHLGLEFYHGVCILGFNSPEWFISELAAVFAGGLAAGISLDSTSEACLVCLIKADADIVVVENEEQVNKILKIRDRVPHLKAIVQYTGKPSVDGVLSWEKLYQMGEDQPPVLLQKSLGKLIINKPCNVVFTSGTAGSPQAVLLSHDNITWKGRYGNAIDWRYCKEVLVSYMPLNHIAVKMADIYCSIKNGATVYFLKPGVLSTSLIETLKEVKPTIFFGVPRVWEMIYQEYQRPEQEMSPFKQELLSWCRLSSTRYHTRGMGRFQYTIAKLIALRRVKSLVGLQRVRYVVSFAVVTDNHIHEFLASIALPVHVLYGMSESTGLHTRCTKPYLQESVGKVIPGCRTKITHPSENDNGEVCLQGRHIFMGYLDDVDSTDLVIDNEGYLKTGHHGILNSSDLLSISGGFDLVPLPADWDVMSI